MLGYDVEYFNNLDDNKLMEIALEEKRVLLTRDIQLFRRASVSGIEAFLIGGRTEAEKLAELAHRFRIRLEVNAEDSRCPKCNTQINPLSKEEVKDRVPQSTIRYYDEFWGCPKCGNVYWQGSHWKKINRTLLEAKQLVELSMKPTQES